MHTPKVFVLAGVAAAVRADLEKRTCGFEPAALPSIFKLAAFTDLASDPMWITAYPPTDDGFDEILFYPSGGYDYAANFSYSDNTLTTQYVNTTGPYTIYAAALESGSQVEFFRSPPSSGNTIQAYQAEGDCGDTDKYLGSSDEPTSYPDSLFIWSLCQIEGSTTGQMNVIYGGGQSGCDTVYLKPRSSETMSS